VPLYEYRCKQCGHQFEKIQSFSAPDEKECPVCKGELERLISAPAVQFKGSGFYSTDYASKSSAKSGESNNNSEKPASPASGKSGSSTDSGSSSTSAPTPGSSSSSSSTKSE
jgi:putative FmdB family regulatory protein